MNIVAHGVIVYAAIPLRDSIMSMVNKGLRAQAPEPTSEGLAGCVRRALSLRPLI